MDKIIVNISSFNRKVSLLKTIESIYNQCDIINIFLNNYEEIPQELYDEKINITITNNELGDSYKFSNLLTSNGYYLTIDDDLIYSKNYVEFLISKIEEYKRKCIITFHGRSFSEFPIKSYYRDKSKKVYHFNETLKNDVKVQFGGTGVMGFHTDLFKIGVEYFEHPNMADVWIGKYANENGIQIICSQHDNNLIHQQVTIDSIRNQQTYVDNRQTKIVNDTFFNKSISIIIPTYNNVEYIEECLSSIIKSCKDLNTEVLIGIDSCKETLEFIKDKSFDSRIKFYFFKKNYKPYIIKNTLAKNSNSDVLLFFDSDDIMNYETIETIIDLIKSNDFIRLKYLNFVNTFNNLENSIRYGEGVFAIKKNLFLNMNGFEPWPVAADTDFITRLVKNDYKFSYTKEIMFYRRVHSNSLTQSNETGMNSSLRAKYAKIIKTKKYFGPLQELVVGDFYEVPINTYTNNNINSSSTPIIVKTPKVLPLKNRKSIDYEKINVVLTKKTPPKMEEKPKVVNKPPLRNDLFEKKMSPRTLLAKKSIKKR